VDFLDHAASLNTATNQTQPEQAAPDRGHVVAGSGACRAEPSCAGHLYRVGFVFDDADTVGHALRVGQFAGPNAM
jgi:hypothetical protein